MPTGYTPIYKITHGGIDITGRFSDRCLSIRVDFSAGEGQEDHCVIMLDDRDYAIARPLTGETITIYLGYKEVGLAFMGSFEIEEVHFLLLPKSIMIKGTASGADTFLKSHLIQEFKGKTLGELFDAMAKKGGLSAEVHPDLKDRKDFEFKNMLGSPYQMIQEMERHFKAVAKIANGKLQVVPRDKGEDASGSVKPVIVLYDENFEERDVAHMSRPDFGSVKAAYVDPKDYITRFVESKSGNAGVDSAIPFILNRKFNNKDQAMAAAEAQMAALNRSLGTLDGVMAKGDPWIHDQQRIVYRGSRDGVNGSYVTDLVSHTYTKDRGIATHLHAKPPEDGGDFESLFKGGAEGTKAVLLDPGPGGIVGTVVDRFVAQGSLPTVDQMLSGVAPF